MFSFHAVVIFPFSFLNVIFLCPQPSFLIFVFIFITCCNLFLSFLLTAVHGLNSIPQQQRSQLSSPSRRESLVSLPCHRPVERTHSEPLPYNHSILSLHASHHPHLQHQQYHKSGLERFKLNPLLAKVRGGRPGHKHFAHNCYRAY